MQASSLSGKKRQEQEKVLTEGFEKKKSALMGGKIYTKISRPQMYQDFCIQFLAFLFFFFFKFHLLLLRSNDHFELLIVGFT